MPGIETLALLGLIMLLGGLLGLVFFGGLWWTVKRLPQSRYPAALTLCSLMVRVLLVVGGFYFLMAGELARLLAALLGFIVLRLLLVRYWGESL